MQRLSKKIMNTNIVTIIGWIVVPALTVFFTYIQYRKSQKEIDETAINRQKEQEFKNLLIDLEDSATEFWINSGSSKKSIRLSIKIKRILKMLEDKLPNHSTELIRLRQEVSGSDFDSPERSELPATHEKFHLISLQIKNIKNIKNSI